MKALLDALKHKFTTHTIAVLLGIAATVAGSYANSGKVDAVGLVSAIAGAFAPATTPVQAPTLESPAP